MSPQLGHDDASSVITNVLCSGSSIDLDDLSDLSDLSDLVISFPSTPTPMTGSLLSAKLAAFRCVRALCRLRAAAKKSGGEAQRLAQGSAAPAPAPPAPAPPAPAPPAPAPPAPAPPSPPHPPAALQLQRTAFTGKSVATAQCRVWPELEATCQAILDLERVHRGLTEGLPWEQQQYGSGLRWRITEITPAERYKSIHVHLHWEDPTAGEPAQQGQRRKKPPKIKPVKISLQSSGLTSTTGCKSREMASSALASHPAGRLRRVPFPRHVYCLVRWRARRGFSMRGILGR